MKKTVLNALHRELGARMVPFGDWDMPVNYGSQIEEHHAVRNHAGMFDVSHMQVLDLRGERVRDFLRHLLANDVARLKDPGKALYSCMLNEQGGVIDDLIVYFMTEQWFRMVVNAGTAEKDIKWITVQATAFAVNIQVHTDLAMVAVQGPKARELALPLLPVDLQEAAANLKIFSAAANDGWFVGRTGYTGEDGFEVVLPAAEVESFWRKLQEAGVQPAGLGARDTLRLEAGMNLYGSDMDETVSPLEAGLSWTLVLEPADRDFIGRAALEKKKAAGNLKKFTGLILQSRGVLRDHQQLYVGDKLVGEITSGGFSPTLNKAIAFARIDADVTDNLTVDIRGKKQPVDIVKPPFARNGKALY
jgi:aminomethyltransferase